MRDEDIGDISPFITVWKLTGERPNCQECAFWEMDTDSIHWTRKRGFCHLTPVPDPNQNGQWVVTFQHEFCANWISHPEGKK